MPGTGRIAPMDLESDFHNYDRVLRQNLALRAVHGPLDTDAGRPPTGVPATRLADENARMRAALERRGAPIPRAPEGAVQPTSLLVRPRWHIPADDPKVCPSCGDRARGRVCGCGQILQGGPAPRPRWWSRVGAGGEHGRTTLPDPTTPYRPRRRWDYALAWVAGTAAVVMLAIWFLQPVFR